ncbi:MAG: nucleotide pyrophosphohydrolase [Gammaproteobacteria bacterium]|nr:nucleotide pyrophosphohydrolase [Gammaproteobacteria bacterium]
MDIDELKRRLARFAAERDWDQFHSPKNLAMALSVEASELLELYQWLSEEQSRRTAEDPVLFQRVCEELADIQIYLLRLADKLDVDLARVVDAKIAANARKYPVALSKGRSTKYTDLS